MNDLGSPFSFLTLLTRSIHTAGENLLALIPLTYVFLTIEWLTSAAMLGLKGFGLAEATENKMEDDPIVFPEESLWLNL